LACDEEGVGGRRRRMRSGKRRRTRSRRMMT
jgi:hypothetical protein